jgi:branched-chain amino acid transport system ATP-binding protein
MTLGQLNKSAGRGQAPGPPILCVRDLSMSFDGVEALSRLNFDVESGEIFGIAGPNGAGKTTLFNVISGLFNGSGTVIFRTEDISIAKPHRICHLGIARTLQIPKIFSTLNVYDNIRFGAHFGKPGRKDEAGLIQDALDFVGLKERKTEIAEHLGLFHKKLIMIAAALATQPELLLLDEPVGGLSPIEINPLIGLIRRINRDLGITIIIIEHLMKVLKQLSDRLMIIHYGKKICIGTSEHVMQDSKVKEIYLG